MYRCYTRRCKRVLQHTSPNRLATSSLTEDINRKSEMHKRLSLRLQEGFPSRRRGGQSPAAPCWGVFASQYSKAFRWVHLWDSRWATPASRCQWRMALPMGHYEPMGWDCCNIHDLVTRWLAGSYYCFRAPPWSTKQASQLVQHFKKLHLISVSQLLGQQAFVMGITQNNNSSSNDHNKHNNHKKHNNVQQQPQRRRPPPPPQQQQQQRMNSKNKKNKE